MNARRALRRIDVAAAAVAAIWLSPAPVGAQTGPTPTSGLLPGLYQRVIDAESDIFDGFTSEAAALIIKARLDKANQIGALLAGQLSSFPLVSSAGGFTWTFEPLSGTFTRSSDSFGPLFAERALTIGRKRLNFGVNYQRVTFDRLEGKDLRGGQVVGFTGLPDHLGDHTGVFFQDALDLRASADTVSVFATYGATDRLDLGVAVPINHVTIEANLISVYGNSVEGLSPRTLVPSCDPAQFPDICTPLPPPISGRASGAATGIGDVVVRAKYNFLARSAGGLAGAMDVRLPTGDERNLLGAAGAQTKVSLIASTAARKVSPHINVGYTLSGASDAARSPASTLLAPPDEINYTGGADVVVSLRTTVIVDVVGRTLRKVGALKEGSSAFGTPSGGRYQELQLTPGADVNLLLGSTGVRLNPVANLLISANVLFPLTEHGLTDRLTWLLGFDYSF